MQKITVTIKTPTKVVYEGEVESISIPTKSGNLQILPNHQNLITMLDVGLIKLSGDNNLEFICIKGIATIRKNNVSVLTEGALRPEQEILDEIQAAIKSAQEGKPAGSILTADLIRAEKQLRYYLLKDNNKQ